MRRYLFHLTLLSLVLVVASFALLWWAPALFIVAMPVTVVYFAVVTGFMHHFVTRSAHKDPRVFIKTFLGLTVGSLLLHLVVMTAYMFTHLQHARLFAFAFAVCYVAFLVFETVELVAFVRAYQREVEASNEAAKSASQQ
ncbi:MAG: hypothetical protein II793_03270 [Bacteroidales bacterium]|nr:hypothetical protein [Bacteroidales bacterium]